MKLFIKVIVVIATLMLSKPLFAQDDFCKEDIILKKSPRSDGRFRVTSIENLHDTTVMVTLHDRGNKKLKLKGGEKKKTDYCVHMVTAYSLRTPMNEIIIFGSQAQASGEKPKEEVAQVEISAEPATQDQPAVSATQAQLPTTQTQAAAPVTQTQPTAPATQTQPVTPAIRTQSTTLSTPAQPMTPATPAQPTAPATPAQPTAPATQERPAQPTTKLSSNDSVNTTIMPDSATNRSDSLLEKRSSAVDTAPQFLESIPWKMVGVIAGMVLLCLLLLLWYVRTNRAQRNQHKNAKRPTSSGNNTDSFVVVGRKTQTILKRQTLDDVYDNEAYIKIESHDFCQNSAIRAIYLKNTCIKDIYNMYAEDLRNPDNPKEDGCMVLGRWVLDEASQQYDVTLEHIVLPGDDAIFAEYELNFGGKIKLKVTEKLRKLRRDTNMQYDLTCWVHSHPGLGVFFSNYDESVHLQLKHPTHPKFLTALVVDILTPQLEMGIFTFRQDMTVNSKSDIQKMYSLEALYQRALESERNSFDPTSHYDILGGSREHLGTCYGIQLSNGAIIDMTFLAAKPTGFVTFAHGYTIERGERTQCIVSTVSKSEAIADNRVLGCFVVASHRSIPSIRKVVVPYMHYIRFVLVYTAEDGLLTAIPMADQNLCPDAAYYGEQKLEELKIWTRRRR